MITKNGSRISSLNAYVRLASHIIGVFPLALNIRVKIWGCKHLNLISMKNFIVNSTMETPRYELRDVT